MFLLHCWCDRMGMRDVSIIIALLIALILTRCVPHFRCSCSCDPVLRPSYYRDLIFVVVVTPLLLSSPPSSFTRSVSLPYIAAAGVTAYLYATAQLITRIFHQVIVMCLPHCWCDCWFTTRIIRTDKHLSTKSTISFSNILIKQEAFRSETRSVSDEACAFAGL